MNFYFELREDNPILNQLLNQGLSRETHPSSYNTIANVSKLLEVSYKESKKGTISEKQLQEIKKETLKTIERLI